MELKFAQNVKGLRLTRGLKQGEILGFSAQKWNNYEKGKSVPGVYDLIAIAKFFEVTETDLLHTNITDGQTYWLAKPQGVPATFIKEHGAEIWVEVKPHIEEWFRTLVHSASQGNHQGMGFESADIKPPSASRSQAFYDITRDYLREKIEIPAQS